MLTMLLAFGGLWFWVVAIAVFFVMVALVENEKAIWAGACFVATMLAFYFCGNSGMLDWVRHNPMTLLYYFGAYVLGATIWGLVKWYLFTTGENEKYEDAKTHFLADNKTNALTQDLKPKWSEVVDAGYYRPVGSYGSDDKHFTYPAPEARNHKAQVLAWMTYWPWSAFWTLLNDPIRRLMRLIYNYISGLLNKISAHAYRHSKDDVIALEDRPKAKSR